MSFSRNPFFFGMPAQAGIQGNIWMPPWTPAFAGVTV
jgi:hypothetical protein